MADVPETTVTPEAGEPPLSREEGRKLLLSMIGTWTGRFDQYGGAEAYVHWLRYGSSSRHSSDTSFVQTVCLDELIVLRAGLRVNPLDAAHLAIAADAGADLFVTNDGKLQGLKISGLGASVSMSGALLKL